MKKHFSIPLLAVLCLFIMSFTVISDYRVEKKTAEVRQVEGIYVFFCAEPVVEYKYLGTAKPKMVMDDNTDTRLYAIIKRAKKDYPECEAIIFRNLDLGSADCIKFKE